MKKRFINRNKMLTQFGHEFLVVCPSCHYCGKVIPLGSTSPYAIPAKRRFVCGTCGTVKEIDIKAGNQYKAKISYSPDWKDGTVQIGGPFDWYFGLPLFLQVPCCGHTLWVYNLEHLEYIEEYVHTELKDSHPYYLSVESRLPKWIKNKKNREQVLKSLNQLKQSIK